MATVTSGANSTSVDFVRIAQPRLTHLRRSDMTGMTIDSSYHSSTTHRKLRAEG